MTASTPHAATYSACRRAPSDGTTTTPASFSFPISSRFGASANEATRTPSLIRRPTRSAASPASARRFTPNGASVRSFTSRIAAASSSYDIVAEARIPSAPARAVAVTRWGPATQPIPVWTIGCRTPTRSVQRVRIRCSAMGRSDPSGGRDFALAGALRVEYFADQPQRLAARLRGEGRMAGAFEGESGRRDHLLDRDSRVDRADPHAAVRGREVEDRQVGDHQPQFVEACGGPRGARPVE